MWKRKELKTKAKNVVRNNYWTAVVVCFLLALFTGEFGTSIIGVWQSEDSMDPNYLENNNKVNIENNTVEGNTAVERELNSILKKFDINKALSDKQLMIAEIVEANLNSATKSQKYIFKIWDAIKLFNFKETILGVMLCIGALLAITFTIFIAEPLIVGGKKYFIEARENSSTKISIIGEIFKKGKWSNVVKIMLLRNIYNILWYLTIIGGLVKAYEYKMIPYILADNPNIKTKEAFKLSKQMMKGNKWRTFILDISFLVWKCLSILTLGLLNILYVNPYNVATITELYIVLKQKAIYEKYEYYESLEIKENSSN